MRLQRLEILGFKSFPDRSELSFDHGVTAIVGPNGCGKSNVVDAITWVLGEQSARSLRGERMEDVIFGGSDARKPTAAAEVKLRLAGVTAPVAAAVPAGGRLLDGEAEVELAAEAGGRFARDVEVSRRLYRSGESEYLIDGEVCRLRDVQDLLMDAGLGIKAYAVIEQGKIGQILSARPTDRRQLIEEAAGVTKFKSRRRAAELKLEAAQQNLTRIDDIVYEVEKQLGALKRQAAKARRYRKLREELRRWEKVLFARRYRALSEAIAGALAQLEAARLREAAAAGRLAEVEATAERLRIELAEADGLAAAGREQAHARELEIGRRQQQNAFDRQQVAMLSAAAAELAGELEGLDARRGPGRQELEERRAAAVRADEDRDRAAAAHAEEEAGYAAARRGIEGLEGDVEAARNEVFSAINAATALRHVIEHAAAGRERMSATLTRLDVEAGDLRMEAEKTAIDRREAEEARRRAREAMDGLQTDRRRREAELAAVRQEREWRLRDLRTREHELAASAGRLRSLEELEAARSQYGDAARLILADVGVQVQHLGSLADYLEVDSRCERAVEACLGDLLQYVLVPDRAQAAAGVAFVREQNAGRCGFLIAGGDGGPVPEAVPGPDGLSPLAAAVRIGGPFAAVIAGAIGEAWIAETAEEAAAASGRVAGPVATLAGDVFRRARLVEGGSRAETRSILTTRREIKELRERLVADEAAARRLGEDIAGLDTGAAAAEAALAGLGAELHHQEKAVIGFELQLARAAEETERLARKQDLIAAERRQAEEERRSLEMRQEEAQSAIVRLEAQQRGADDRLAAAQRRLFESREEVEAQGRRAGEAKARHATLVERAAALAGEIRRLEDAARELEDRIEARGQELARAGSRREALEGGIVESERILTEEIRAFEGLQEEVRVLEERSAGLSARYGSGEEAIREARRALEEIRAAAGRLEVARATAEADLGHLAASCLEAVGSPLEEVDQDVAALEQQGEVTPDATAIYAEEEPEAAEGDGESGGPVPPDEASGPATGRTAAGPMTAEEAIAALKARIDRLGPVNMMAIDQFDELETRHTFLISQRKDLVDAIAATGEAIRRIEKTTRERFREAFTAINLHFEETFTTLFGGGRAGLVLLDQSDLLESGIDIIAQPPGKRLQSVQLLSGGEKALTAMALMFAIFKYRPSPFCLLDEIDAPLDDANIGRFVEMLQGMQRQTQFILITHNRKTMEIADRLYGITMEEPGVSKLISLQLN